MVDTTVVESEGGGFFGIAYLRAIDQQKLGERCGKEWADSQLDPFPGCGIVFRPVFLVLVRYTRHQRIHGIWVRQEGGEGKYDFVQGQSRGPGVFEELSQRSAAGVFHFVTVQLTSRPEGSVSRCDTSHMRLLTYCATARYVAVIDLRYEVEMRWGESDLVHQHNLGFTE